MTWRVFFWVVLIGNCVVIPLLVEAAYAEWRSGNVRGCLKALMVCAVNAAFVVWSPVLRSVE